MMNEKYTQNTLSAGKLFVIESGTDGSGKATQTELLCNALVERGYNVLRITFPDYESNSSALVKMYLKGEFGSTPEDVNPYVASQFFAVDRFASFKTRWSKAYMEGAVIIADRYTGSNAVHQAVKFNDIYERETFLDWLWDLEFVKNRIPVPTSTIFLDLPPEASERLRKGRENKIDGSQEQDIHESNTAYMKNCYDNALYVAKKYSWHRIDCTSGSRIKSRDSVHEEVLNHVLKCLS